MSPRPVAWRRKRSSLPAARNIWITEKCLDAKKSTAPGSDLENTEIVAVCDVSETRRLAAKEKFSPGGKEYLDYREVLGRNDIDGVVIGAPDHWHVPMTVDAVKAGKDVYVEKPVSHTIEEGERVQKAVLDSKQVVQVGYQQRSWPHFLQAREIVAEGKLGQISLVLTSWYQDYVVNQALPQL